MAKTSFAQHGLIRLGYEVSGEGDRTFMVLHGLLQDRVTIRPLVDALEPYATVLAMDIRGHGGSSAVHGLDLILADLVDDAWAVLDSAGVAGPVTVIGVELGAVIAAEMRIAQPDRVTEAVLVNFPTPAMLDVDTLNLIAERAYKEQAEQALNRWLDLSWELDWREIVPKPRAASARRSAGAIHPMLMALVRSGVTTRDSIVLPGGTPFADEANVDQILSAVGLTISE